MSRRLGTALFSVSLLLGCGAPQEPEKKVETGPTTQQLRITNISYTDLAVCYPKPPAAPAAVNKEVLIGLLLAARPQVMDCFVDPKNRGGEKETRVTLKATLDAGKVESTVTGENLSPEGKACVEGALNKWLGSTPDLAAKASPAGAPVSAELPIQHVVGVSPSVTQGVNEGSDVAAAVRLAEGTWCDCYAEWKDAPPRTLKAKIRVLKRAGASDPPKVVSPAEVTFEPTQDAAADRVAACLQKKVSELKFTAKSEEFTVPYSFLFVNTSQQTPLGADVAPEIQLVQLDGIRGYRAAEAVIAVGGRTAAALTYDGLVAKYKAKPASVPVEDLKARCADLVKADDGWIAAVERQLDIDQKTLSLVSEFKAKDPQWAKAEAAAQTKVDETKKDLEAAKKTKTDDTSICPKER